MRSSNIYCTVVFLAASLGSSQLAAVGSVVVPADAEHRDGTSSFYQNTAPPPSGARFQELYLASELSSLPDGRGVLIGLAWRPDKTVRSRRTTFQPDSEIRLSTTDAEPGASLSYRFDDNIGDDETLVYSGDLQFETDGSGPFEGPRDFDYVVTFQQPFIYDSKLGNLLVEWRSGPGNWGDGEVYDNEIPSPESRRMIGAFAPSASWAAGELPDVRVVQFELTWLGDANLDGQFNSSDMVQVFAVGKYETDQQAGWAEGDWDGNDFFDSSDMVTAFADGGYEQGLKSTIAAVPEPSGVLLLVIGGSLWLAGRRDRHCAV